MSVFSLVLILVAIIAAVVLLFPVVFRLDFHLTESGFVADLFVFKKRLWNYTKEWKTKEDPEPEPEQPAEEKPVEKAAPSPEPETSTSEPQTSYPKAKRPQTPCSEPEASSSAPEAPQADPHFREDDEPRASRPAPEASSSEPEASTSESQTSYPKAKRPQSPQSLTEREFWTLLLTPDIDERGLRYSKKILNSFLNVFQVRFRDCYVEGIRMDYKSMGYGAALNAILKGYPFLEDWDLRMDWTRDHDLQSAGHIEATVNLCRTVWFLTVCSVYGGIFAFVFWRRRAAVLKTGELPELGYVRTKILNWLVEE
ncbi:MAG: hypothetical protein IKC23_05950 [Fibrobacter sp.]|nr:hypothetical protein [Fibrobacter sp.]